MLTSQVVSAVMVVLALTNTACSTQSILSVTMGHVCARHLSVMETQTVQTAVMKCPWNVVITLLEKTNIPY